MLNRFRISHNLAVDSQVAENDTVIKAKNYNYNFRSLINFFRKQNLRTKTIAVAIIIGTTPVISVGGVSYYGVNESTIRQINNMKQADAKQLAIVVNNFMLSRYRDIEQIANLEILVNLQLQEKITSDEKVALLLSYSQDFDSIAVFDLNGHAILQTKQEAIANQKNEEYFQNIIRTDKPYISQPINSQTQLYLAAPVKDKATGQLTHIVRAAIPVKQIEKELRGHQIDPDSYNLVNGSGKIFIASDTGNVGSEAKQVFPLSNFSDEDVITKTVTYKNRSQEQLVTIVPWQSLDGLSDLKWKLILSSDRSIAFATQQKLLLALGIGTVAAAIAVGGIAAILANRFIIPILNATKAVKQIATGDLHTRITVKGKDEFATLGENINRMADQLDNLITQQRLEAEQLKLFTNTLIAMRQSLNSEDLFKTTILEARQALKVHRVAIYHFNPQGFGQVIAESVASGFPVALDAIIETNEITRSFLDDFQNAGFLPINNVTEAYFTLENPEFLQKLQIKSSLVTPIIKNNQLFGFLVAHHCFAPHTWQAFEINFLRQLAVQVGLSLERTNLLEATEQARQGAEINLQHQSQERQYLQKQILELVDQIETVCQGDLTVRAEITEGDISTIADFFNVIIENLREIVIQVQTAASQVNYAIAENSSAIGQLSHNAIKQADDIHRTLDSVDHMRASIKSVAKSAKIAAKVARNASYAAENGSLAMDSTVENILVLRETIGETAKKVKRLGESSQQISRVVSLINQIAMQTNLLAINASIEAARAGEEAQGFAVVAEEVSALAARSATATNEIEAIVINIQQETSEVVKAMELGTSQVVEGTKLVEVTKRSLGDILQVCHHIDDLVQSISNATVSQVQMSKQVTTAMKQVAEISESTSYASREVSLSLEQTVEISQQLQNRVGAFRVD